jgi:hypothetical protein
MLKFGATTFQTIDSHPAMHEQLAKHMSHLPSTHAHYYHCFVRNHSARLMQKKIHQIMGKKHVYFQYVLLYE